MITCATAADHERGTRTMPETERYVGFPPVQAAFHRENIVPGATVLIEIN